MGRRSTLLGALLVALLAVPTGSAGATPDRVHPSTTAFCISMNHFLGFIRSAPRPSSLRKPSGRRLTEELRSTAPRSVAPSAKTLARSLEHVAEHGRHSLNQRANEAANTSLLTTAQYVVDSCTDPRETHAYAQLISDANEGAAAKPARADADWG
jgi:hypothetical protein